MEDLILARLKGIRNFHAVNSWLYRGGQPTEAQFTEIVEAGIKTVVCLRWGQKVRDAEQKAVEATGMTYIGLPHYYWRLPTTEEIDEFLNLLDTESARPIFVHCYHGSDRTGLLIAMYRLSRQSWTFKEAYKEMRKYGFHRFRLQHFKWVLYAYARKEMRRKQLQNQP